MTSHADNSALDTDIAGVGMAGRFAGARSIDEYWNNLRNGVESLSTFTEAELAAAGVNPAELADPNYVKVGAVLPGPVVTALLDDWPKAKMDEALANGSLMQPQEVADCVAWLASEKASYVTGEVIRVNGGMYM